MNATKIIKKCKTCGKDLKEEDYVFMGYCEQCFEKYEKEEIEKNKQLDSIPYILYDKEKIEPKYQENEEKKKVKGEARISYASCIFWGILAVIIVLIFANIDIFPINIFFMIPGICIVLNQYLYIKNMRLYYTNKRVVGEVGIINIKTLDTPINKVNNIYVSNSILGFGTICISSSSGEYIFKYVKNAEELKNGIMEEIEKYEQTKIQQQAMELAKAIRQQ